MSAATVPSKTRSDRYLERLDPWTKGDLHSQPRLVADYAAFGLRRDLVPFSEYPTLPRKITERWLMEVLSPWLHDHPALVDAYLENGRLTDEQREAVLAGLEVIKASMARFTESLALLSQTMHDED